MRKTLLLTIILLATLSSFAQGFTNYKAVIANDSGTVLSNQAVSVRFTIFYNDGSSDTQVFQEIQNTTTDTNGIIILNIGEGNPMDWFAIDWNTLGHYLQTEYDTGSGFVDMGTQAFRTVPYSQYAYKSQYSIYAQQADEVDFNNITNVPAGLSDGDDDTHLTETEVDDYVANNGYLTAEIDGDTTNELQTISKDASNLVTLSNGGGSFTDDNTQLTETEVDDYVANNGYLTTATLPDQTDDDFFEVGTTTQPNSISDAIYHTGNIVIGTNTGESFNTLTVKKITTGTDELRTIYTEISGDGTGDHFGSYHILRGSQAANFYGTYNRMNSLGNGRVHGIFNLFTASGDGNKYGIKSQFASNTNDTGKHFGVYNDMYGSSSNSKYGVYTIIYNSGDGDHYGTNNYLLGSGSGNKYGTRNTIDPAAGGTHYAVYGDAQKSGSYAGYFIGTVSIKDGTQGVGKVFTSNANGKGNWETPELNDLSDAKTGGYSTFIGAEAGQSDNGSNTFNVGVGYRALKSNTSGYYNTAIGISALMTNTTGYYNTAIGYSALRLNTIGHNNTANGRDALYSNTTGDKNTAIGYSAGYNNQTGNKNVFLGYGAGFYETGSDKLYIENSDSATPLIGGDFATDEVTVNGKLLTINNVGGDADLYIKSSGSNNPGVHYYLDGTFRASTGYSVSNAAYFVYHNGNTYFKDGNILPDGHITRDIGANGTAWNNVYAHNFITQGSAAYTDRNITNELLAHPPIAKKDGDFDAQSDGLYELNPQSLPKDLHTDNGLKIDEIATYNYKANYEQQVLINKQQNTIEELKTLVDKQQVLLEQLVNEIQTLKQK